MGYWDQLNTSKQNNKPQPYDDNFTGPVQPLKNGPPLPADTVNGPKLPASLAQKKEGDGFWAGLVKSPIKTLVVRPATRIAQAVSAPAALYSERSNTDTRERLITTQNQLAEAMRKQTDPTKKKKLAAAIADNQKTLDQFGGESEIVNKTLDKVFGPTEVNIPLAGSYNIPAQKSGVAGVKQIAGDALETAATLYGGEGFGSIGKEIVTNTVKKTLIQVAKPIIARGTATGTVGGFGFGLGQSLQEDMGLKDTIINTAVNTAVGAGSGALVSAGGFAVGQGINKAIQATTETKNALVEQLLRAGYSKERAMQLAEQGGYVGVGRGGYSADDLSKVAENSLLNNPENKLNKPNRLQGEGLSYQEATTGLANNGKYLKDRIVIGKNDAGTTILKDGTHLLEAYREKGLPIPADKVKLEDGVKLPDLRERGFISSVRQSPSTAPQVASEVRGNYTPITNAATAKEAADLIRLNPDLALRVAKQTRPTAKSFAVAQELILKYQNEGNFEQAIDLAEVTAKKATQSGQAIQALSMYSRLSPEGVLRFAQRQISRAADETNPKAVGRINDIVDSTKLNFDNIHKEVVDKIIRDTPELSRKIPTSSLERLLDSRAIPAEMELASRITPFLKTKKPNPVKEMINTLYKLSVEQLPLKQTKKPKDAIEFIGQALRDKDIYKDVWAKAQTLVRQKYINNPQALELLDNYFNKTLLSGTHAHAGLPIAQKQIDTSIRQELKLQNVKLGDIVRQFYTETSRIKGGLTQALIDKANIPAKEAMHLSMLIDKRFEELVTTQKTSALNRILREKKINIPKSKIDKIIEISNLGGFNKVELYSAIAQQLKIPHLSSELAEQLVTKSNLIQKLPEGRAKDIETAKLLQTISNIIPPSIGKKVSTIQTLAQLLNPKTIIRNIIGNTGFTVLENVSDVVGTPIDKALSVITGERTKTLPSVSTQMKSFNKGLREGVEDAWLGIDTSNNAGAKFDLPNTKVFKGKVLGNLEKLLSVSLRAPDRAAYEAAFQNSIKMQLKLNKLEAPTQEMIQQAHLDGLYRTFNDDSAASRAFQGIKDSLNKLSSPITGNDWGLGDLVLKYPKTPGNLLARGIDYSPAGFLQATIEMAKPLFGKTFNQRDFVNSVSRATVGTTGLVGVGALLHRIGILTGKANSDSDINAVQRATGIGQYKFNVSALKRFVLSGFDTKEAKIQPGDKLVSYDWFQPAAIGVAMGANIDESMGNKSSVSDKAKSLSGSLILALGEGVNTLGEQPLIQGITRPFKYAESIGDAALQTLKGVPASFIPTLLAQVRYIIDRNQRNLTNPSFVGETVNLAQNKIPGLSELLPQRYTATGEPMKYEQGPISTLINPSIITKYAVSPAQKLVLDIYNSSGEKQQAPRLVPKTETVNGEQIKLTGEQQSIMQRLMGEQVNSAFDRLANNQRFLKGSDEDKAKVMASIMTDIHTAVKFVVLGHRPNRISDRAKFYITQIRGDVDLPQNTGTTNTQQETPTKKKDYWSGL